MTIHSTNKNITDAENSTGNAKDQNSDNDGRDKKNEGGSNDQSTDCSNDVIENSMDKNICIQQMTKVLLMKQILEVSQITQIVIQVKKLQTMDQVKIFKMSKMVLVQKILHTKIQTVLILKIMGVCTKIPKKMKMSEQVMMFYKMIVCTKILQVVPMMNSVVVKKKVQMTQLMILVTILKNKVLVWNQKKKELTYGMNMKKIDSYEYFKFNIDIRRCLQRYVMKCTQWITSNDHVYWYFSYYSNETSLEIKMTLIGICLLANCYHKHVAIRLEKGYWFSMKGLHLED